MPKTKNHEAVDANFEKLLAEIAERHHTRLETAKNELKTDIIPALKKLGIAVVQASYSGYGDSGCVDTIDYLDVNNKPIDITPLDPSLGPKIERLFREFLPDGFENNEGGQGDITLAVQKGVVTIEHQENHTETHNSTQEYTL
jgi:hypothetical protein